ncbi:DUF885 domain-containing protein [Sphingopyxis terrae]|uniref:Uncharacterized conserved protein, DUF885 familyt n=1 Tax=Sphingopyxis terrae subsp. ummariensis TaxID=429001 RepID=A0A1Y6EIJ9_9SPHN|nr:DUF885 domain-containing protein [Sphingopyxis terrae]PCF93307.1 DUF885 domain-containing protein [Sphingopyxis terrae subsp. ummariensis]SMQ62246.1 Uncharacterized conserved protein, DUF885 familyt [Sphingopyxis terrae subsp. ummariensis]
MSHRRFAARPSTAILSSALVLLATAGCTPATVATAPQSPAASAPAGADLAQFFDNYDEAQLSLSPQGKAYRGIRDADYGKWNDPSDDAEVASHTLQQATAAAMRASFDPAKLSPEEALSFELFNAQAARAERLFPFRDDEYIFDQMNGAQSQMPAFLINIHRVANVAEAEAYVERIRSMGPVLDALSAESARRAKRGVQPPKWVYAYVISDIENLMKPDNAVIEDIGTKVGKLDIDAGEKTRLTDAANAAWAESAGPAYGRLLAEMKRQQAVAPTQDGIWRLPDGKAYYAALLANYTTTDMSAAQIHALGLSEVARIHGEMKKIMAQVGFKGTLREFFEHLRTSPQYYYTTREDYLADVDAKVKAMEARLPAFFHTLPKAHLQVKAVEAFREKSAGKAFYQSPSPDGSRPGTYYVNLYDLRDMSKTELEALAYHEGIPGHHLQRAVQTELTGLPPFRRFGGFTAYTEGWGLYSEELAKDMGFYTDPYSDFGRLGMELWRACRLVVDTGIHDKRWSREQAIQYLKDNTPNPDGDIEKAIERYIVYPGQATAYLIGKLKIMELRTRAQAALGDRFDYRDFHDVVLKSGPVPLDILERRVDAWIAASR